MLKKRLIVMTLLLLFALGVMWSAPQKSGAQQTTGTSTSPEPGTIILLTVDSLRNDHLGCYGNKTVKTPAIDSLASDGILFERCITPVPQDLPAHAAIMTGNYPERSGVFDNASFRLPEGARTLASVLKQKGYFTAAFVGSAVLGKMFGLAQGFDLYDGRFDSILANRPSLFSERTAGEVLGAARDLLKKKASDKPLFIWIHLNDPNEGFAPPSPFEKSYKGEIEYCDSQLGQFFADLKTMKRYDHAAVILTSDHGISLGENGEKGYGVNLYEPAIKVPLIIKLPGERTRPFSRFQKTAGLIDLMPTILTMAGIREKIPGSDGHDLLADPKTHAARPYFFSSYHQFFAYGWPVQRGVDDGEWKFIKGKGNELFKLSATMREVTNQFEENRAVGEKLLKSIEEFERSIMSLQKSDSRPTLDFTNVRHLAYMGYPWVPITSFKIAKQGAFEKLLDIENALQEARQAVMSSDRKLSIEAMQKIVQLDAANYAALNFLTSLRAFGGRIPLAQKLMAELERLYPDRPETYHLKGHLDLREKNYDLALSNFKKTLEIDPLCSEAMYDSACMYSLQNKKEDALSLLGKSIDAGYDDFKNIEGDPDLANVRDTERYKEIVRKGIDRKERMD